MTSSPVVTTSNTTSSTTSPTSRRIATGLAVTASAAVLSIAGAGAASASTSGSYVLAPGQGACVAQYASYQVHGDGRATGQGAKFKLLRNGVVILNTANRAAVWVAELRTSYGTFPGPGLYSLCAQNTGTTNTIVTLTLSTDSEF